jgi:4-diphosphocytidyl-2-C-methyl-D-erythritol kinase
LDEGIDQVGAPSLGHAPLYAAMSGSGSALFGVYGDADAASAAESRLAGLGVGSLRTRMLGRAEYWEHMYVAGR